MSDIIHANYVIRYRARAQRYDVLPPHSDFISCATGFETVDGAKVWINGELARIEINNTVDDREYD